MSTPTCSVAVRGMMLSELVPKPFPDEKEFSIFITEVISPTLFYGQLVSRDSVEALQELSLNLYEVYSSDNTTGFTPKINEICVAKFTDGQWYRASVVLYNSDMTARVFFLDFGNKCDVETTDIRCIKDDLLKYPRLAQKYSLANIKSPTDCWNPQSIEVMTTCHSQLATVTCVTVNFNIMECSLKLSDHEETIEEKLLKHGLAVRKTMPCKQENNTIDIPVEDVFNAIVMHFEDMSLFHGQLLTSENISSISEITSRLNELSSVQFDNKMQIFKGTICAGFHLEYQEWYRVKILDPLSGPNETVLLELLDYGDKLTMERKQLRPLPSALFKIPWKAIPMCLDGAEISKECSSNTVSTNTLKQHILQKKCLIEIVRRSPDKLRVKITCENIDCHNLLSQYLNNKSAEGCQVKPAESKMSYITMIENIPFVTVVKSGQMIITNVESPSEIHGQLVSNLEDISQLDVISNNLGEKLKDNTEEYLPKIGEVCAAEFAAFEQYFRGVVLKVNDNKTADVQFIDYGNKSTVPFSKIAPLSKEHSTLPRQAVQFALFPGVSNSNWPKECIEDVKVCLLNKIANYREISKELDTIVAELEVEQEKVNKLFSKYLPELTTLPVLVKIIMVDEIPFPSPEDTGQIIITNVESPSEIYGQLVSNLEDISQLDVISNNLGEKLKDNTEEYLPKIGEVCAAEFAEFGQYFRGVALKVNDNKTVDVQYIDYGNKSTVPLSKIAPLSKEHSTLPRQAVQFALFPGVSNSNWPNDCISDLKVSLLNKAASYKILSCEDKVFVVELGTDDEDQFINTKFAKFLSQPTPSVAENATARTMIEDICFSTVEKSGQIIITNVESPSEIYGQLVSNLEDISQLDVISNNLGEKLKDNTEEYLPKIGEVCAAEFAEFQQFFRGVVLKVNDNKTADVQFIDYGNKSTVPLSKIAPLSKEHSTLPRQAVQFALFPGVSNSNWPKECIEDVKVCLLNKAASYVMLSIKDNLVIAEINVEDEDVNARFAKYNPTQVTQQQQPVSETKPIASSSSSSVIDKYTDLPAFQLPEQCDVTIQHVENTSLFFAQENSHEKFGQLSELTQLMIEHYAHNDSPYQPKVNELCCGLFDGIWSRCYVLSTTSTDANALFIDFGNSCTLAFKDIRKIESQFVQLPSFAFALALSKSSVVPNVTDKFIQLALNQVFEMEIVDKSTPVTSVILTDRQTGDNIEDYLPEPAVQEITKPKEDEPIRPSEVSVAPPTTASIDLKPTTVTAERIMTTSIPDVEVPSEGVLAVVNIEGPHCIYGQLIETNLEQIAQLDIISMELTEQLKESDIVYEPVLGEACAAYFASFNQYFRVNVKKINVNKTAEVQSVDYGNSTLASFEDLAPLPKEYSNIPKQAVHVALDGITATEWIEELNFHLQSILLNKMLNYKVISQKDGAFVMDMDAEYENSTINVSNYLRQNHLKHVQPEPVDTTSARQHETKVEDATPAPPVEEIAQTPKPVTPTPMTIQTPTTTSDIEIEELKTTSSQETAGASSLKPSATVAPYYEPHTPTVSPLPPPQPPTTTDVAAEITNSVENLPIQDLTITENQPVVTPTQSNIQPIPTSPSNVDNNPSTVLSESNVSSLPNNIHPLESVAMKMGLRDLSSGTYELKITHTESPYLIYANFKDKITTQDLNKLSQDMASRYADPLGDSTVSIKPGVLSALQINGVWMRGIVTSVDDENAKVFLIDYGNLIDCSKGEVRPLFKELRDIPAQALPLKLITIKPNDDQEEWSNDVCQFLRKFTIGQDVRVKPEFKDSIFYGVRMKVQGQPLDKLLSEAGYGIKVEPQLPVIEPSVQRERKAIPFSDIAKKIDIEVPLSEEFEAYATCVVSPRLFYCRLLDDEKEKQVDEIAADLKATYEGKDSSDHEFSDGDMCAVKLPNNQWYRGFILKIHSNDTASVWLADFGSKYPVDRSCLFPLPESFMSLPAQMITLQMQFLTSEDPTGYSKETCEYFRSLVVDRILKVRVMKRHETIYRVVLTDKKTGTDVGDKMVNEGYAKYIFKRRPQYLQSGDPVPNTPANTPKKPQPIFHYTRPQESMLPMENDPYDEIPEYNKMMAPSYGRQYQPLNPSFPSRGRPMNGRGFSHHAPQRGAGRGTFKYPQQQRNYNNNDFQQRNYNNNNHHQQQQPNQLMNSSYRPRNDRHLRSNINDSREGGTDFQDRNQSPSSSPGRYNTNRPPRQSPTVRGGGRPHHTPGSSNFHRPSEQQQQESFDPYQQRSPFENPPPAVCGYEQFNQQMSDPYGKQHGRFQHFNNSLGGYDQQQPRYNRGGMMQRGAIRGGPMMGGRSPSRGKPSYRGDGY